MRIKSTLNFKQLIELIEKGSVKNYNNVEHEVAFQLPRKSTTLSILNFSKSLKVENSKTIGNMEFVLS